MIAVLLCAGFATRMYPLTRRFAKPLLEVGGKLVVDYLMDQVVSLPEIDEIHVVTNQLFAGSFDQWRRGWEGRLCGKSLVVHNDGAIDNDSRLGACGDLQFVLKRVDASGGILVSAGDNVYRFKIAPLWKRFLQGETHYLVALPESDLERLRRTGVPEFGAGCRILRVHEKPRDPPSQWCCPPLYFLRDSVLSVLDTLMAQPENPDALGHLADTLCREETVCVFKVRSSRLDIGSLEGYRESDLILRNEQVLNAGDS
jgi:glucose-1-phosphate thymidylyltransferase